MKLIIEEIRPDELKYITEDKDGKKNHYIIGKFMQAEVVNGNKRIYPKAIMEREVGRYNENYVTQNRAFGELGHPDTPKINLDRVSHLIVSLKPEGNDFIGKARILDTPFGNIAKGIMEGGGKLGVSSRGVGSLKPSNGVNVVQDDYYLATAADIVADPSAPNAFVEGIMEEKNWIWESGIWKEQDLSEAKLQIERAAKADLEYKTLQLFEKLMSKLSNS